MKKSKFILPFCVVDSTFELPVFDKTTNSQKQSVVVKTRFYININRRGKQIIYYNSLMSFDI